MTNHPIEIAFVVYAIIIFFLILIPSVDLLSIESIVHLDPEVIVKVTGKQWFWEYEVNAQSLNLNIEDKKVPEKGESTDEQSEEGPSWKEIAVIVCIIII